MYFERAYETKKRYIIYLDLLNIHYNCTRSLRTRTLLHYNWVRVPVKRVHCIEIKVCIPLKKVGYADLKTGYARTRFWHKRVRCGRLLGTSVPDQWGTRTLFDTFRIGYAYPDRGYACTLLEGTRVPSIQGMRTPSCWYAYPKKGTHTLYGYAYPRCQNRVRAYPKMGTCTHTLFSSARDHGQN